MNRLLELDSSAGIELRDPQQFVDGDVLSYCSSEITNKREERIAEMRLGLYSKRQAHLAGTFDQCGSPKHSDGIVVAQAIGNCQMTNPQGEKP
jgi:hypothetical protein